MQDMSNVVALKGTIGAPIIKHNKLCGLDFDCYITAINTTRKSGVVDTSNIVIPVEFEEQVQEIINLSIINDDVVPVICTGKLQTTKSWQTGRVLLYVLADYIGVLTGKNWEEENETHIENAELGKNPIFRETPKGRYIADVTLKIPNEIKPQGYCYIPTIFWGRNAELIKQYQEGDQIGVTGRLQSRNYTKKINDDLEEFRTAYELSVNKIDEIVSRCDSDI